MNDESPGEPPAQQQQQQLLRERFQAVLQHSSNRVCADCTERNPCCVSMLVQPLVVDGDNTMKLGIFCCDKCSEGHCKLGDNFSVVKLIQEQCEY